MMDICTRDATLCSFRLTCRFVFVSRQTPLISAFRWINTWAQMSLTSVIRAVITAFSLSRAKDVLLSPFQVSECTDQCFVSGSLNSNSNKIWMIYFNWVRMTLTRSLKFSLKKKDETCQGHWIRIKFKSKWHQINFNLIRMTLTRSWKFSLKRKSNRVRMDHGMRFSLE